MRGGVVVAHNAAGWSNLRRLQIERTNKNLANIHSCVSVPVSNNNIMTESGCNRFDKL